MNHCVPDWNMEDDSRSFGDLLPAANPKTSMGPDNELVELVWQNGHVVMHSQTHRKAPATVSEFKQVHKPEPASKCGGSFGNSSNLIQEDETASWFQYPLDDSLEKDFLSEFFYDMPTAEESKDLTAEGEKYIKVGANEESNVFTESVSRLSSLHSQENTMPPPKSQVIGPNPEAPSLENSGIINFSHFSRPVNGWLGKKGSGNGIQVEVGESSSMMTVGSSICGSNQVQNRVDMSHPLSNNATGVLARGMKEDVHLRLPRERAQTETFEASTSGGSGYSFGRSGFQNASNQSHKRKGRDAEESECQSEEAEYELVEGNKSAQRSASARRSRAAEVHNLSERRRRDRINEKMKALQELIPHCNKSDKASMLDEAIEYLKSLQLQVQIMWMGGGMAPMMFPGVQQYMSRMSMAMGHSPMPSSDGSVQLPRIPLVNQFIPSAPTTNPTPICPSPVLNPSVPPNQMQNANLAESYGHYLGFHHMRPPPQGMNLYSYGSHMVQQNQTAMAATSSDAPIDGVLSENVQNGKSG